MMKQLIRQLKEKKLLSTSAALAMASMVACAGTVDEGEELDDLEQAEVQAVGLTEPVWQFCARVGARCNFEGTRQVRYGRRGNWTVGTFTDGVRCQPSVFGRSSRGTQLMQCQVDVSEPEEEPVPEEPTHEHPHPEDPSTNPAPMPMPGMDNMPYVNVDAIPTGSRGVSTKNVRPTTQQPAPGWPGAFRTSCAFSHMNFDDPIIYPGQPGASHLHAFFGNTLTDAHSTAESLRNSGNSTCRGGTVNRSAYWVPALLDRNGNPIAPHELGVYYKTGYLLPPSSIKPFPQGLRMIAGDPKATGAQGHAGWKCEDSPRTAHIPTNCAPGKFIIMEVSFPQCWNGRDLDSADHRSHMAYPTQQGCPSSHPYAIPDITFNVWYRVPSSGASGWHLASDMYDRSSLPGGYSAHGDWFEGWDPEAVQTFVRYCDNAEKDCFAHLLGDGREIY